VQYIVLENQDATGIWSPAEVRTSLLNTSRQATTQLRVALSLATGVQQMCGAHFGPLRLLAILQFMKFFAQNIHQLFGYAVSLSAQTKVFKINRCQKKYFVAPSNIP
jgi:hypothetical protein